MIGEKTFGVRVDGVYPKRVEKYGPVINIDSYGKSKRKKEGHLKIRYEKGAIEKEYPNGKIPPLVEDLINIALAVFCADHIVQRKMLIPKRLDKEGRLFSRKINLVVPVSDTETWQAVRHKLEKTISFMTYDLFRFRFIKRKVNKIDISQKESGHDSVSLFSGGIDSLAGSYFLSVEGYRPIFVSINHTNISPVLTKLYDKLPIESTREINVKQRNIGTLEYTQFSRSFLYLAFACAVALAYKNINKIFIPENGIIARQIGLKEGRHGTKTAHPQFLIYFNELINAIFPKYEIAVENPFSYKTKAGVVKEIINKEKLKHTISCGHTFDLTFIKKGKRRVKRPNHCGMCIPCIIRTISFIASGLPNAEEILNVYFNPFSEIDFSSPEKIPNENERIMKRRYRDGLVNILDIMRLAFEIKNQSYEELVPIYPEFLDVGVYDLYKRFSRNVLETVKYFIRENHTLKIVTEKLRS